MKKILFFLSTLSVAIYSCNPMDDIYSEMAERDPSKAADITLTLTDDDYEAINDEYGVAGYGNFESTDEAKQYVPYILRMHYPNVANTSSALVTYNLYRGLNPIIFDYTGADAYSVKTEDYASADAAAGEAGFFNNDVTAGESLPAILAANIDSPEDGEMVAVNYQYASIAYEDISGVSIFSEDFEALSNLDGYTTFSLEGAQDWHIYSSSSGYKAARMSGYSGGNVANQDWLIFPQIDLAGHPNAELKLNHVVNFLGDGVYGTDIAVMVSTDYDGSSDPSTNGTWTSLTLDQWPAGNSYDEYESAVSLADYAGEQIYVGLFYRSTTEFAPQWRVISIAVEEGESIATTNMNVFYEYNGSSWSMIDDNVYYLSSADYDAMGAPGQYDNFSSSVHPDNYLPAFLKNKYTYAQEEDEFIVIYKYFSSGSVQTRGDVYTFTDGNWAKYQSEIQEVLQFGKENGEWIPDNTIKYELGPQDYSAIASNTSIGNESARSNLATYGNFNTNGGYWTKADIVAGISFILLEMNPSAEEGQKYLVTYDTYPAGPQTVHVILEDGAYVEL